MGPRVFSTFMALGLSVGLWIVAFDRLAKILPRWPEVPRKVPWGGVAVGLVIAAWIFVSLYVASAYFAFRGQVEKPPDHAAIAGADAAGDPVGGKGSGAVPTDPSAFTFREQMLIVSLVNTILVIAIPMALKRFSSASWADMGLSASYWMRDLKLGAIAFYVVTPLVMGTNLLAVLFWKAQKHPLEHMLRQHVTPSSVMLAYLSAVILAPAAEELIFRGIVQAWLRTFFQAAREKRLLLAMVGDRRDIVATSLDPLSPIPPLRSTDPGDSAPIAKREPDELVMSDQTRALETVMNSAAPSTSEGDPARRDLSRYLPILLTSFFFSAVHFQQMPAPIAIFPLSVALGLLYERTNSLIPSFVLHALFNGFNTTVLLVTLMNA